MDRHAAIRFEPGDNPERLSAAIVAEANGPHARTERFAFYLSDRPATFLMDIPDGASRLTILAGNPPQPSRRMRPMLLATIRTGAAGRP